MNLFFLLAFLFIYGPFFVWLWPLPFKWHYYILGPVFINVFNMIHSFYNLCVGAKARQFFNYAFIPKQFFHNGFILIIDFLSLTAGNAILSPCWDKMGGNFSKMLCGILD